MQLSTSPHYQRYSYKKGYRPADANNTAQIKQIVKTDWCPGVFNGDTVGYETWDHCDWLYFDVDNTPGSPQCSIAEFIDKFAEREFYLITSRNHQKEKPEKNKKNDPTGRMFPSADRYHVLFPQPHPITKGDDLDRMLTAIIEKYPFFDADAKGRNRFFFGFDGAEVTYHEGKPLVVDLSKLPAPESGKKKVGRPAKIVATGTVDPALLELQGQADASTVSEIPIDRDMLFAALELAAEKGAFDDRSEWVKLGASLYVSGYDYEDWIRFSHQGEDTPENLARWEGFRSTQKLSAGSLFYFIREKVDPLFMTPGAPARSAIKDRMVENLRRESSTGLAESTANLPVVVGKQKNAPAPIFKVRRPTKLDAPPPALVEKINQAITYVNEDGEVKIKPDWFQIVFDLDGAIQNCRFYDYTMGVPAIAYANTDLLRISLYKRLCYYVPIQLAMKDKILIHLIELAQEKNQYHNRVAAFIDETKDRFPRPKADVLDRFMRVFTFTPDSRYSEAELRALYREVWHLFFLRMHCHIDGTRMKDDCTGPKFLMENDIVPVLRGDQNQGKTTLCKWLAADFTGAELYAELGSGAKMSGFGGHDTIKEVRGKLLAELGEMRIMRSAQDVETVKSFISKKKFAVDVKYVEYTHDLPVTVSYIGTSNPKEFLNDPSGNRRFFPIDLAGIDLKFLAENEDLCLELHSYYAQMAEAISIPQRLDSCKPSAKLLGFMRSAREEATVKGDDYNLVVDLVSTAFKLRKAERSPTDSKTKFHTITGFQIQKMATDGGYHIRIGPNTIQTAMQEMGYTHAKIKQHGAVVTGWKRPLDEPFREDEGGGRGFGNDLEVNVDG